MRDRFVDAGEVRLSAKRADGSAADHAVAVVAGAGRMGIADETGEVSVRGLPAMSAVVVVTEDEDQDGVVERGALVPVELIEAPVRHVEDGPFASPPREVIGALLGEVTLEDARTLTGTVDVDTGAGSTALDPATDSAVVAAWHDVSFGEGADARTYTQPALDVAHTTDGAFSLRLFGDAVRVGAIVTSTAFDGRAAVVDESLASAITAADALVQGGNARVIPIELELAGVPSDGVSLEQVIPNPPNADTGTPVDVGQRIEPDAVRAVVDVPIGVLDLVVQTGETAVGLLRRAPLLDLLSTTEPDIATLGPIALPEFDPCQKLSDDAASIDCDRDGLRGLPFDGSITSADCACSGDLFRASCDVGGETFDCDDDADGQADADEPVACRGPLAGTDLDGDGLCSPGQQ